MCLAFLFKFYLSLEIQGNIGKWSKYIFSFSFFFSLATVLIKFTWIGLNKASNYIQVNSCCSFYTLKYFVGDRRIRFEYYWKTRSNKVFLIKNKGTKESFNRDSLPQVVFVSDGFNLNWPQNAHSILISQKMLSSEISQELIKFAYEVYFNVIEFFLFCQ